LSVPAGEISSKISGLSRVIKAQLSKGRNTT